MLVDVHDRRGRNPDGAVGHQGAVAREAEEAMNKRNVVAVVSATSLAVAGVALRRHGTHHATKSSRRTWKRRSH